MTNFVLKVLQCKRLCSRFKIVSKNLIKRTNVVYKLFEMQRALLAFSSTKSDLLTHFRFSGEAVLEFLHVFDQVFGTRPKPAIVFVVKRSVDCLTLFLKQTFPSIINTMGGFLSQPRNIYGFKFWSRRFYTFVLYIPWHELIKIQHAYLEFRPGQLFFMKGNCFPTLIACNGLKLYIRYENNASENRRFYINC